PGPACRLRARQPRRRRLSDLARRGACRLGDLLGLLLVPGRLVALRPGRANLFRVPVLFHACGRRGGVPCGLAGRLPVSGGGPRGGRRPPWGGSGRSPAGGLAAGRGGGGGGGDGGGSPRPGPPKKRKGGGGPCCRPPACVAAPARLPLGGSRRRNSAHS